MAFVPLPRPAPLGPIEVNPDLVDAVEDVPGSPGLSFVSFIGDIGTRETCIGTPATITAALNAGMVLQPIESGTYAPAFSAFIGQAAGAAAIEPFLFTRIGQVVTVCGTIGVSLNPGAGSASLEASLPPTLPKTPGTGVAATCALVALPSTPAPEAPVNPFSTATTIGFDTAVTGLYPAARILVAFSYLTP